MPSRDGWVVVGRLAKKANNNRKSGNWRDESKVLTGLLTVLWVEPNETTSNPFQGFFQFSLPYCLFKLSLTVFVSSVFIGTTNRWKVSIKSNVMQHSLGIRKSDESYFCSCGGRRIELEVFRKNVQLCLLVASKKQPQNGNRSIVQWSMGKYCVKLSCDEKLLLGALNRWSEGTFSGPTTPPSSARWTICVRLTALRN